MAIKVYEKGDATKLAANFRASEFDCQGNGCCATTPIDEKLVDYLQQMVLLHTSPVQIPANPQQNTYDALPYNA